MRTRPRVVVREHQRQKPHAGRCREPSTSWWSTRLHRLGQLMPTVLARCIRAGGALVALVKPQSKRESGRQPRPGSDSRPLRASKPSAKAIHRRSGVNRATEVDSALPGPKGTSAIVYATRPTDTRWAAPVGGFTQLARADIPHERQRAYRERLNLLPVSARFARARCSAAGATDQKEPHGLGWPGGPASRSPPRRCRHCAEPAHSSAMPRHSGDGTVPTGTFATREAGWRYWHTYRIGTEVSLPVPSW